MTTRLRGEDTHFLPFNRGSHPGEVQCGAGNPQHPSGYRTGYFWEDVLQRDSFLDILGHFMFVEKKEEKVDDGKGGQRRDQQGDADLPALPPARRSAEDRRLRRAAKDQVATT